MNRGIRVSIAWLVGLPFGGFVMAAPETSIVSQSWQLDFEFHDPQRIEVQVPGSGCPTTFWYLLYAVTNATDSEVEFYPSFRLVTDTLEVVAAGDGVLPQVYDAIAKRHAAEYPFFVVPHKVGGRLLQGRENTRTSAAVFRVFDENASRFTVFAAGLSGEMDRVANPAFDSSKGETEANPSFFLFRRTLAIKYDLPGDPVTRSQATPRRRSREWVMR